MGFAPSLIWMKTPSQLLFTKLVASFLISVLIKIGDKGLSWEWYFVTIILMMGFYSSVIWMEGTCHQKRRVYWPEDTLTESRSLFFTFHGFIRVALNWRQHSQFLNLAFLWLIQHKNYRSQGIRSLLIFSQEPTGQCCGNSSLNTIKLRFPTNAPISPSIESE
jgi:hypothetical protein